MERANVYFVARQKMLEIFLVCLSFLAGSFWVASLESGCVNASGRDGHSSYRSSARPQLCFYRIAPCIGRVQNLRYMYYHDRLRFLRRPGQRKVRPNIRGQPDHVSVNSIITKVASLANSLTISQLVTPSPCPKQSNQQSTIQSPQDLP